MFVHHLKFGRKKHSARVSRGSELRLDLGECGSLLGHLRAVVREYMDLCSTIDESTFFPWKLQKEFLVLVMMNPGNERVGSILILSVDIDAVHPVYRQQSGKCVRSEDFFKTLGKERHWM